MKKSPTVIIQLIPDPELGGFTAYIDNLPAVGEGETEEKAIADLKESIQLFVDEFGMQEAISRIVSPAKQRSVSFAELVHG